MTQITITCPHCNFSKVIDSQRVPAGAKKITCPHCKKAFPFGENSVPDEQPLAACAAQPGAAPSATPVGDPDSQYKYCPKCGLRQHISALRCPKCDVAVPAAAAAGGLSKVALLLITFFFGGIGGHKFYQKKYLWGFVYLLFCWTSIPSLVAFVEFIIYACRSEQDLQQRYSASNSGALVAVIVLLVGISLVGILAAIAIPQYATYRERAFSVVATKDLEACRLAADSYYAENHVYPTHSGDLQCRASQNVALYYLALGPDEYQLVSYHQRGRTAFLKRSSENEMTRNTAETIKGQLSENFGASLVGPDFHFVEM